MCRGPGLVISDCQTILFRQSYLNFIQRIDNALNHSPELVNNLGIKIIVRIDFRFAMNELVKVEKFLVFDDIDKFASLGQFLGAFVKYELFIDWQKFVHVIVIGHDEAVI